MKTPVDKPVGEVKATLEGNVQAECPSCHHKFWHKLEHVLTQVVEVPIEIIATNAHMGGA